MVFETQTDRGGGKNEVNLLGRLGIKKHLLKASGRVLIKRHLYGYLLQRSLLNMYHRQTVILRTRTTIYANGFKRLLCVQTTNMLSPPGGCIIVSICMSPIYEFLMQHVLRTTC